MVSASQCTNQYITDHFVYLSLQQCMTAKWLKSMDNTTIQTQQINMDLNKQYLDQLEDVCI